MEISGAGDDDMIRRVEAINMNIVDPKSARVIDLLRRFLTVQERRAEAYSKLERGFSQYMASGGEEAYQQLCLEVTGEFNDCSNQVLEMESLLLQPELCRDDLAELLRAIQTQEKQKLHLTVKIQILLKSGRPSERLVSHDKCCFPNSQEHVCVHLHELTESCGSEDAEADAEYDITLKEARCEVQEAVNTINEHLQEVRYEIAALKFDDDF